MELERFFINRPAFKRKCNSPSKHILQKFIALTHITLQILFDPIKFL